MVEAVGIESPSLHLYDTQVTDEGFRHISGMMPQTKIYR